MGVTHLPSTHAGDFADTGEVADFADTGEATFFTGVCVAADAGEFADGALLPETAALPSDWETGATAAEPKADGVTSMALAGVGAGVEALATAMPPASAATPKAPATMVLILVFIMGLTFSTSIGGDLLPT